jgi:hypothetical protein
MSFFSLDSRACRSILTLILGGCITLLVYAHIFFSTTNNLETYLNVYSEAISNYQAAGTADRMMASNATLQVFHASLNTESLPFSLAAVPDSMSGPNAPVALPVEVFTAQTAFPADNLTNYSLSVQYSSTPSSTVFVPTIMPSQQLRTASVECTNNYGCSADEMREKCQAATCSDGVQNGGPGAADNYQQLTCIYMSHVPYLCKVITKATDGSNRWEWSTDYEYCDWPFKVPARKCGYDGSTLPFQIRTDDDPYIILSKITEGKMYFGVSLTTQRIYGGLCLTGGVLVAVGLAVALWLLCGRPRPSCSFSRPSFFGPTVTTRLTETDPVEDYFSNRTAVKIQSTN